MRTAFYSLILLLFVFSSAQIHAQTLSTQGGEPDMPEPLAKAVEGGAQVYYLGEYEDLYGWALIRQGSPEFYYANKKGTALLMGLLFNGDGEMVTNGQLSQLQYKEGDDMFAMTNSIPKEGTAALNEGPVTPNAAAPQPNQASQTSGLTRDPNIIEPLSPAQEMYVDVRAANWVTFGENGMYEIFVFIDPDCLHCQAFIREMQDPFIKEGYLKIRAIPIGFTASATRKAALLLASSDPAERLLQYAQGNVDVLDPPQNINTRAVDANRQIMRKYGLDATPTIIYRAGNGEIRFIRGKPDDYTAMIQDLLATR